MRHDSRTLRAGRLWLPVLLAIFLCSGAWAPSLRSAQAPARTVWDGVFTQQQAGRGEISFLEHCSRCHGSDLEGGEARALKGDRFWNDWKESTVDTLLGRISANMPYSMDGSLAGSLPERTYVDIVALILSRNGFPPGDSELSFDSSTGVQIITQDGPGELPASTLVHVVGCLAPGEEGGWKIVQSSPPVRAEGDDPEAHASAPLGDREYALRFVLTSLDRFVGHRVLARGLLIGEGGVDGINLSGVSSIAETCP
jgi:hypothetical protein